MITGEYKINKSILIISNETCEIDCNSDVSDTINYNFCKQLIIFCVEYEFTINKLYYFVNTILLGTVKMLNTYTHIRTYIYENRCC